MNRGTFPIEVRAPAQDGVHVRALAVYLQQAQFVPAQRTCEALAELCGCELSTGTLAPWVQQAATTLQPTVLQIAEGILASPLQHGGVACGISRRTHQTSHAPSEAFSKIKTRLRRAAARGHEARLVAIGAAVASVTSTDALGWFHHAGYRPLAQSP